MPKDEIDPEDPLELHGVALLTEEDTSDPMTECFVEEFMRLGYEPAQILGLFRNRHYTGPNMVLLNRGERYVRTKIAEVFGWWGRPLTLREDGPVSNVDSCSADHGPANPETSRVPASQIVEFEPGLTDPGGAPVPRICP
ncbi:MAG: hypothetical protein JNL97_10730 [Verrucomicrobiales bacterium]|nr:hypothetical protein [Verrucomicrobiales bacterium]